VRRRGESTTLGGADSPQRLGAPRRGSTAMIGTASAKSVNSTGPRLGGSGYDVTPGDSAGAEAVESPPAGAGPAIRGFHRP
jgi:hypothetical protein